MKLRSNLIKIFSLAFAVCTAFAIATMPAKAQEETASFSIEQNATIRNEEDGILGLQFSSSVNAKWLTENSAEKYTFGTLFYPASNEASFNSASEVDANIEALDAVSITHVQNAMLSSSATFKASIVYDEDVVKSAIEQSGKQVTDALVEEVLYKLYSKEFTARSYATLGNTVIYTDAYTTTINEVAIKTYELGEKEGSDVYKNLALNFLSFASDKTAIVNDENGILSVDGIEFDENVVVFDKNGLLKYGVDYVAQNGNLVLNVNYVSSKVATSENLYLQIENVTTKVLVSYVNVDVNSISVELKDANAEYLRTDDICDYLTLKLVYSNETVSEGLQVSASSVKSVVIENGVATVTVEVTIANRVYQDVVTIAVSEAPSTVAQVLSANVGGDYLMSGVVVSFATTIDGNEVVLMDKQTKDFISVTNLGKGNVYSGSYYLNGVEIGDEIVIPVTLKISAESTSANSNKLYAEFIGGNLTELSVISKNNAISVTSAQVIDSNADLEAFLSGENTYKVVKFRGEMNFVMDCNYELYDFWFYDKEVNKEEEIAINGLIPAFSNPAVYLTTGKTFGEIAFGNSHASNYDVANPMNVIKEITAIYLGGNTSFAQFIILDESAVVDATPVLTNRTFVAPKKLDYVVGDTINLTGATITSEYDIRSNITIDVTDDMLTQNYVLDTAGNYTITGVYDGFEFSFEIRVLAFAVESLEILAMPNKSTYTHRDTYETLDLTGAQLKVNFVGGTYEVVDITKLMINLELSDEWKIGTVNYKIEYLSNSIDLPIVYQNTALTVSQFKAATVGETYDVTGVVVAPMSSIAFGELLIKDKNSNDSVSIVRNGVYGSYDALKLDTTVLNVGDEIVARVVLLKRDTTDGGANRMYGDATDKETFISGLIVLSSGNSVEYDLTAATQISSTAQLKTFLDDTDGRNYKIVKFVGLRVKRVSTAYTAIFFSDVTTASAAKYNKRYIVIDRRTSNTLVKTSDYIPTIGKDDSSITYENAVVSEYEVYAIYIGGNSSYHSFVIMSSNWFVKPTTV